MIQDEIVVNGNRALARSYAKINLTLDVLGKRDDGYHSIETIMQTVSLYDTIIVEKANSSINISSNYKFLPNNEKNITHKAATAFFNYVNIDPACKIILHKNVPVSAGLAGGSGNAATVLCALDKLYNTKLSYDQLTEIGVKLGADVPFCLRGGTALATGIGEILSPLPAIPKCPILIVKPPISVSTESIYKAIDSADITSHPDTQKMIEAIKAQDINAISDNLSNVMEVVTENMHPVIKGIRNKMMLNGALGALMSGSGPSVFGIFPDYETAKKSHDSFYHQFKDVFFVTSV